MGGLSEEMTVPLPLPALLTVREFLTWAVLLISTETLLEKSLVTARSGLPSPLKSPTATEEGLVPVAKLCAGWKVPSPLPSSTDTSLEPELAVARSCTPSPLKSPTATDLGLLPTANLGA